MDDRTLMKIFVMIRYAAFAAIALTAAGGVLTHHDLATPSIDQGDLLPAWLLAIL